MSEKGSLDLPPLVVGHVLRYPPWDRRKQVAEEENRALHLWGKEMDKKQYHAAKARLVAQMQEGQSWQAAAALAGIQTSQSTAYRLLQVVRKRGEAALQDGRHGHPSKLRAEA